MMGTRTGAYYGTSTQRLYDQAGRVKSSFRVCLTEKSIAQMVQPDLLIAFIPRKIKFPYQLCFASKKWSNSK